MKAPVKCECGLVYGDVEIMFLLVDYKPTLTWSLNGCFYVPDRGDRMPKCSNCRSMITNVGEWK